MLQGFHFMLATQPQALIPSLIHLPEATMYKYFLTTTINSLLLCSEFPNERKSCNHFCGEKFLAGILLIQ